MEYIYKTKGTCSTEIKISIDGNTVENIEFKNGCEGNLKAISSLVKGLKVDDVIERCSGITCGRKKTSCADQLATAIREACNKTQKSIIAES